MDYKNHLKTGVMAGVVLMSNIYSKNNIQPDELVMYSAGIVIGSALPDIDHPRSYMAKKLSAFGWIVSRIFSHRGFTHSILFVLILTLIRELSGIAFNGNAISLFDYTMLGMIVGVSTHIFMDLFVGNGVKLFYPINKKISVTKLKAGSKLEDIFLKLILIVFCISLFYYNDWLVLK